jgi:hypothetical protein
MSIDTSKNKALSSPQTIAQWFALEFRQIPFPEKSKSITGDGNRFS